MTNVRQDDLAAAHIDQRAYKHLGLDSNPYAKAGDVRMMFEISLFSVQGNELIDAGALSGQLMTRSGHPTSVSRLLLTFKPGHQPLM